MTEPALVDIVAMRPRDREQLQLMADRLRVQVPPDWRRTLRWAGRGILITHANDVEAERVLSAAKEAGVEVMVRPSHPEGRVEKFIALHHRSIARSLFVMVALGVFIKLLFFRSYNSLIHLAGLLYLIFISRDHDPKIFDTIGPIAGAAVSLLLGYVAMISVHVALVWTRLGPPLVAATQAEVVGEIHPVPWIRSLNWRKLLPAFAVAVGLGAVAIGGVVLVRHFDPAGDKPVVLASAGEPNRAQAPLPADPWKAREALEDRVRPRPDRRVLLALADVDRLVTGAPSQPQVAWAGGAWRVSVNGAAIGTLPAIPTFADALRLLRVRTKQLTPGTMPGSLLPAAFGTDDEALTKLRRAQVSSGSHLDAAAVHEAAAALATLSFHAFDSTSVADVLPARALAALAVDEELHQVSEPAIETLLAAAMGYLAGAREAAGALASGDPIRLYVLRDDEALRASAEAADTWPRILWLRRLQELHQYGDAYELRQRLLATLPDSIALLHLALQHSEDVLGNSIQAALPEVQAALDREIAEERRGSFAGRARGLFGGGSSGGPILETFERRLDAVEGEGPLFDAGVIRAYYRGAMYSGIRSATWQLAEGYGEAEKVHDFYLKLGKATAVPAQHLLVWVEAHFPYASRYEYTRGKPGPEQVASALQLGPDLIEDTLRFAGDVDPAVLDRARRMVVARMDTRPGQRQALVADAIHLLHDAPLAKRFCASVLAERIEEGFASGICARVLGDKQKLLEIAHAAAMDIGNRAKALTFISDMQLAPADEIDAEFAKLLPFDDGYATVADAYVPLLDDRHDPARAQRVVEQWLAMHPQMTIPALHMHDVHARMLLEQGNAAGAWTELEPLMDSFHGGILRRAAYVLSALGRAQEAESSARKAMERYQSDWRTLTTLLEVQWRDGNVDQAKQTLLKPPWLLDAQGWRVQIGPAFGRAFQHSTGDKALAAFAVLRSGGLQARFLREMALGASGLLADATVLEMVSSLVDSGAKDPATVVAAAALMRKAKDANAASDWLRSRIKPDDVYSASRLLFEAGEDGLLWTGLPDPLPQANADRIWLLRAAAARRSANAAPAGKLAEHFAAEQGGEAYLLGRFVAGLGDESSIRASLDCTRTAWALAVRAEAEGRRDDATAWYGVALAGGWTEPERRFAEQQLTTWSQEVVKKPAQP